MSCLQRLSSQSCDLSRTLSVRSGLSITRDHRHWCHTAANTSNAAFCDIDAEPLHRYRLGGYHPVHLGDSLKSGRYQILHKLGWGGYATVWLAKDHRSVSHSGHPLRCTIPNQWAGINGQSLSKSSSRNSVDSIKRYPCIVVLLAVPLIIQGGTMCQSFSTLSRYVVLMVSISVL
jgi:hypothetical protein